METLPVHAMKAYREAEVQFHSFLPSELHAGEWSASHQAALVLE